MQTDSVGRDLRQGTMGMACFCPWVSGVSAKGESEGWGLAGLGWRKRLPRCVSMGILAPGWGWAPRGSWQSYAHCPASPAPGLRESSRPPSGSAGFHLQIQAVGPALTAACSMAGEGSPEPVAVAGGQEEGPWEGGAAGGSFFKIMTWFNCHFKSRCLQGSRGGFWI